MSFTVAGDGTAPLAYQWRKDGVPLAGNASAETPTLTLSGITTADAGSYDCVVSNAAGAATSAAAVLTVEKALAVVTLSNLVFTYDGLPHAATMETVPAGLPVVVTYNGSTDPPVNAGSYAVVATVVHPDYFGSATDTLTINKALAAVAFVDLTQPYDGTPRSVATTTTPAALTVIVTYDGSLTPPVAPGSYAVVATISDANYFGSASGTLVVTTTALVRHAPTLNGRLNGPPGPARREPDPQFQRVGQR